MQNLSQIRRSRVPRSAHLTWIDSNTILVLKLLRNQHDRAHAHSLIEINVDITDYVAKFTDMLLANLVIVNLQTNLVIFQCDMWVLQINVGLNLRNDTNVKSVLCLDISWCSLMSVLCELLLYKNKQQL